ncbi:DUF4212 domain-containing protein [Salarchaeum sp. JOR-1]|uniref:DUF4212 domain-containing protein n=1 Tax=Salarchaeum sp. JOR-1 TaxID=2599399 RepID=UPI001198B826|nr:DUF4212 domain-containing protein [Salarchaeum sp. JOR-1]QDX40437.1 DUF4212 domain-containing protein [Salarchaeum sp. JOR-1]
MTENDRHDSDDERTAPDGGTATAAQRHRETNYLQEEVNLLNPSTEFMRDHLRLIWTGFIIWAVLVFGPVTATALAPETMTMTIPGGFPLHYFLVAVCAPAGALILSFWYARRRDALDEKYGISHGGDA